MGGGTKQPRKRSLERRPQEKRRKARRNGAKEQENASGRIPSIRVRFELAGFGEYGSFVVRRGAPRLPTVLSLYFSFALPALFSAIQTTEPSRTERTNERTSYLPVLPDGCSVSAGGEAEWKRGGKRKKKMEEEEKKEEEKEEEDEETDAWTCCS